MSAVLGLCMIYTAHTNAWTRACSVQPPLADSAAHRRLKAAAGRLIALCTQLYACNRRAAMAQALGKASIPLIHTTCRVCWTETTWMSSWPWCAAAHGSGAAASATIGPRPVAWCSSCTPVCGRLANLVSSSCSMTSRWMWCWQLHAWGRLPNILMPIH